MRQTSFSRPGSVVAFLAVTGGLMSLAGLPVHAADRPNILVIMADDLGFSDLGCYGSDIDTPNLDRLAAGGLRFTQFLNASRCCPTRAALLTGKYAHEVGLRTNGASLSKDATTLAEIFREHGYHTAMTGKWHLTHAAALAGDGVNSPEHLAVLNNQTRVKLFGEKATYPAARGFDRHYGVVWGIVNFFHPFALVDGFKPIYDLPDDFYLTGALNEKTAEYIRDFAGDDKPFFLYLAHTAPHWPLHARAEDRAKYSGRYDDGWEAMRRKRYARQVDMGLIDPDLYPLPEIDLGRRDPWRDLDPQQRVRDAAKMETHAAMIDRMDQGIGDVIAALEETSQLDNTLIVFLSDNGASPEEPTRPGYDRPSETPDGRTIRYTGMFPPEELGRDDTWTGLGPALANACNTPFRYWKKESYHGGCASPLIVHWPAGLKTDSGGLCDELAHVFDLMPTFLDSADIDSSPYRPRGKSLLPVLRGKEREGHDELFFEHAGGAAFRKGDWKIVRTRPSEPWALYDLSADRTETKNLADQNHQRVTSMDRLWSAWWEEMTGESSKTSSTKPAVNSTSPRIANRPLEIVVEVNARERPSGVVIAQGGIEHGYSIHFVDGKPAFDVRVHGKVTRVIAKTEVDTARMKLTAKLNAKKMMLVVNDQTIASADSPGLVPVQPKDELSVGLDTDSNAGDYEAPNPFNGTITSTRVVAGGRARAPGVAAAMDRETILSGIKSHDRALFVKSGWIRDPYIIRGPDDYFYLTGTTPLPDEPRLTFEPYNTGLGKESIVGWKMQVWRTRNFADWESLGTPFTLKDGIWFEKQPDKFESVKQNQWRLWAPELHWVGDRWALVHTSPSPVRGANLSLTRGSEIARPWSNPMGPGIAVRHDPSMFQDDDGTWWLIWGATSIAPLKSDFSDLADEPTRIGPGGETAKMGHEGCLIQKIHGKYVLFGTGWSTGLMRRGSYNLYYATADKITGPYSERKFVGRFLGHGTPFQDREGRWWCTAFYNANVPPLSRVGIRHRHLGITALTINQLGTTLVPLDVRLLEDGSLRIRAKDPDYANPGPDEAQDFGL